jgi:hypothetical protein
MSKSIRSRLSLGIAGIAMIVSSCTLKPVSSPPLPKFTKTFAPLPGLTKTAPPSPSHSSLPVAEALSTASLPSSTPRPSAAAMTPAAIVQFTPPTQACDLSVYVSDVTIPDETKLAPGKTFTKTWELKNIGSCYWSKGYSMTFLSGDEMGGSNAEINQRINPGNIAKISVPLTAPDTAGTYTGYWILTNSAGMRFGEQVYVQIIVSAGAAISTATPGHE